MVSTMCETEDCPNQRSNALGLGKLLPLQIFPTYKGQSSSKYSLALYSSVVLLFRSFIAMRSSLIFFTSLFLLFKGQSFFFRRMHHYHR